LTGANTCERFNRVLQHEKRDSLVLCCRPTELQKKNAPNANGHGLDEVFCAAHVEQTARRPKACLQPGSAEHVKVCGWRNARGAAEANKAAAVSTHGK